MGTSDISTARVSQPENSAPLIIKNFWETYSSISENNLQESYNDAIQFKQEALSLFNFGYLSLSDRARAENLYWACCNKIAVAIADCDDICEELAALAQVMAVNYYINLSIFQSAPDAWAIDQLFPIMPLQRLNEKPTVKGTLADLTCDSDGKVNRFIDRQKVKNVLELHELKANTPYYLGMFLVGAYQEVMGNLHNLFGSTNIVQVKIIDRGYQIDSVIPGDRIKEVLSQVQYDSENLLKTMQNRTEQALQNQSITLAEAEKLLENYASSLNSYTYLKN